MPFVTSQFLKRKVTDRPDVVPEGSTNLALTGQFVEVPDDCVFTMEYSVRSAQMAVFKLLNLDKEPNPFPRVSNDLHVVWNAVKTLAQWPNPNRQISGTGNCGEHESDRLPCALKGFVVVAPPWHVAEGLHQHRGEVVREQLDLLVDVLGGHLVHEHASQFQLSCTACEEGSQ